MKTVIRVDDKNIHLNPQFVETLAANLDGLIRKDANDMNSLVIFERQLEFIEAQIYKIDYPNRKMANGQIVKITSKAGNADKTYTYRMMDRVGNATWINSYAKDWKRVGLVGKEVTVQIKPLGDSYAYNFEEVRAAAKAGVNLESDRAEAARDAINDFKELIGFFGDTEAGIKGLNELVETYGTEVIIPADGSGSSTTFASKDPDKILRDMNSLVSAVISATKEREKPNVMLLPVEQYTQISTTRVTDTETTILEFFLKTQKAAGWIQQVIPYYNLEGAGAGALDRMMVIDNAQEKLSFEQPIILEILAGAQTAIESEFMLHSKTAGIIMKRPLSTAYADGI